MASYQSVASAQYSGKAKTTMAKFMPFKFQIHFTFHNWIILFYHLNTGLKKQMIIFHYSMALHQQHKLDLRCYAGHSESANVPS